MYLYRVLVQANHVRLAVIDLFAALLALALLALGLRTSRTDLIDEEVARLLNRTSTPA